MPHPTFPQSNVSKLSGYHPDKYALDDVSPTIKTDESLTPNRPPCLTQQTISKFLQPLTRDLVEVQPRPTIDDLPDEVIDNMVLKDKAFWVDKPGVNAYTLHDAYYNYGVTTEKVLPREYYIATLKLLYRVQVLATVFMTPIHYTLKLSGNLAHQDVFPRSYQYDLDCVKYRRQHACDGLKDIDMKKPLEAHCKVCAKGGKPKVSYASGSDSTQERWRYYPDVTTILSPEQIRKRMEEFGRPFKNEACNWYNEHYPSQKFNCIMRKFSK